MVLHNAARCLVRRDDAGTQSPDRSQKRLLLGNLRGVLRRGTKRYLKKEVGAHTGLAGDRDVPSHEVQELARDRQTEAGAPIFACGAGIGLGERAEKQADLFGRNADTRVADGDMQPGHVPCLGMLPHDRLCEQKDFTAMGELDGIADEIDEDLLEAVKVADDVRRDRLVDVLVEFDPLFGSRITEHGHRLLEEVFEIHGDLLKVHLRGLQLGEVEDVIDEMQERLPAGPDHPDELALFDIKPRVQQQRRGSDDAVHRRANLMAHAGEEVRLRFSASLRELLGGEAFLHDALLLHLILLDLIHRLIEKADGAADLIHAAFRHTVAQLAMTKGNDTVHQSTQTPHDAARLPDEDQHRRDAPGETGEGDH